MNSREAGGGEHELLGVTRKASLGEGRVMRIDDAVERRQLTLSSQPHVELTEKGWETVIRLGASLQNFSGRGF